MTSSELDKAVLEIGNGILRRVNASQPVANDVVQATDLLFGRLVQSGNTLKVLNDNAKNHDWTWDAASIVRTSYDAMLQALYVFHDDAKRDCLARRFLDFKVIEQVKMLRLFDNSSTSISQRMAQSPRRAVHEPEIKREFDRVCQKYNIDQSRKLPIDWHGLHLGILADKCNYKTEYELMQKQLSAIVHSSVFGLSIMSYLKPELLIMWQRDFAFRVLDKVSAYAGIQLSDTERKLLDLSKPNIFDRTGFPV